MRYKIQELRQHALPPKPVPKVANSYYDENSQDDDEPGQKNSCKYDSINYFHSENPCSEDNGADY